MSDIFDVVIIGAGPAGYVGSIKAAKMGLKVACVEKEPNLGGTCLNVGCIPSKALLQASEHFHHVSSSYNDKMGVELATDSVKFNLSKGMKFKQEIVEANTKGVAFLFKKNKVHHVQGQAKLVSSQLVEVTTSSGVVNLATKRVIIATGSEPIVLDNFTIDEERIVTSTGALSLPTIPQTMVVIGAGVIGLELGSVWSRLGTKVEVIEYGDKVVPSGDTEMGKVFLKSLQKQGLSFMFKHKVLSAVRKGDKVLVKVEDLSNNSTKELTVDVCLVAIGRKPVTRNLGLEALGVTVNGKGQVVVNEHYETNVPNIYAVGDVIAGPMLAHKAYYEAETLIEKICGHKHSINYNAIPSVVYTSPEYAFVGKTEEELIQSGIAYKKGTFPLSANARSKVLQQSDGMIKILGDATTDRVLGMHIVGPSAGEMIHLGVMAIEFFATVEDLALQCIAHPTVSEAIKEAAFQIHGGALHI